MQNCYISILFIQIFSEDQQWFQRFGFLSSDINSLILVEYLEKTEDLLKLRSFQMKRWIDRVFNARIMQSWASSNTTKLNQWKSLTILFMKTDFLIGDRPVISMKEAVWAQETCWTGDTSHAKSEVTIYSSITSSVAIFLHFKEKFGFLCEIFT